LDEHEALAERLRSLRGERSLRGFARELGIDHQKLSNYESGLHLPDFSTLAQFGEQGIDLNWLILGE
jgi:transcriptional regulator with XRE-family HTH domain